MRANRRQSLVQVPNRAGFALLMLLIVVAIGMLIYYFALSPVDRKTAREQKKSPDTYPWVEEWRIKDRKGGDVAEQPSSEGQPLQAQPPQDQHSRNTAPTAAASDPGPPSGSGDGGDESFTGYYQHMQAVKSSPPDQPSIRFRMWQMMKVASSVCNAFAPV